MVLLTQGADIDEVFRHDLLDDDAAKDTIGTAQHVAVQHDQQDFVRFLLQRRVRKDLTDKDLLSTYAGAGENKAARVI